LQNISLTVGNLSNDQMASGRVGSSPEGSPSLGVGLAAVTPDLRQQLGLPDGAKGAVINQVQPGSIAEQAGLQQGDVIVGVGDRAVVSPADATRAIRESMKSSQAVALRIIRDGQPAFIAVSPGPTDQANGDMGNDDNN
jgi:serine protease Do